MTLIVIIAISLICLLEGVPLFKKRMWKELITVGFMLTIAILLQISYSLGIITPLNLMEKLLEPIGRKFLNKI